jgi:metal-responsive CopG/Arc/MetJ family transcriptional regulator
MSGTSKNRGKGRGDNLVTMSITLPREDLLAIDMLVLKRKMESRDFNRSALVSGIISEYLQSTQESE